MSYRLFALLMVMAVISAWSLSASVVAEQNLPSKAAKACLKCHKFDKQPATIGGRVAGISKKAKTIQVRVNGGLETVYFDDQTDVQNVSAVKNVKNNQSVRIVYYKKDGKNFAKLVEVKKGLDVPKDKLANAEDVAKLVAQGPEKGKYVLIDSRPPEHYNRGHIPTAKAMPFFAFDKLKDKILPKDKEILQVYYCSGFS
jgi:hypothetical protein